MSHTDHYSHSNHSSHSNHGSHTNTYCSANCITLGTTMTKLDNPQFNSTTWNDLKAKINTVRASWQLSSVTYTPTTGNVISAVNDWNTYVSGKLTESPIPDHATKPSVVDPPTATAGALVSTASYNSAVDSAQSKYCASVCFNICNSVHSHHDSHTSHQSHNIHTVHNLHTEHSSHNDHSNHRDHSSHSDHSSHAQHSFHGSSVMPP